MRLVYHFNSSDTITDCLPMDSDISDVPMPHETHKSPQAVWYLPATYRSLYLGVKNACLAMVNWPPCVPRQA
jgi:hypothetical protein